MTPTKQPTRADAWALLNKYVSRASLLRHSVAVEASMRHFAAKYGEDVEKWGAVGLLHDLDYELYPEEHCRKTPELLEAEGYPGEWGRHIISHGWKICADVEPTHRMEMVLYTVDQLTGLIAATALMRPSKSVLDLPVKSVKKKWKDKAFAANVDRAVIQRGVDLLGVELDEIIAETIAALRAAATELNLAGPSQS